MPETSIIIRAFNEEKHIEELLQAIKTQDYRDYEIILVDSGSTDNTLKIAKNLCDTVLQIKSQDFTFGHSLNVGCRASQGKYIVLISAHAIPVDRQWLSNLLAPFRSEKVAMVYGKQIGNQETKFSETRDFKRLFGTTPLESAVFPYYANNANAVIRKELWQEHPFDEYLPGLEDIEWARYVTQKGFVIHYEPKAGIYHIHTEKWAQVFNRYRREAIASARVGLPHPPQVRTNFFWLINNIFQDLLVSLPNISLVRAEEIGRFRYYQWKGTRQGWYHDKNIDLDREKYTLYYPGLKRGLVFIEDEIDLKIFQLVKKLKILNKDDNNLLAICCDYHLLSKAKTVFSEARYIFDLVEAEDAKYLAYQEANKAALLFFEKVKQGNYPHLHYSLLVNLQQIFYNILISEELIKMVLDKIQPNLLFLLPTKRVPTTFYTWGHRSKNPIFGAVLNRISRKKKKLYIIKNTPWILRVFLILRFAFGWWILVKMLSNLRFVFQFLPVQRKKAFKGEEKKSVILNWGGDIGKHTVVKDENDIKGLISKMEDNKTKVVHLPLKKEHEELINLYHHQNAFRKKSLRRYLLWKSWPLAIEVFRGLNEALSILKDNAFFEKRFYFKELYFAYFYLYLFGTGLVEGYRTFIVSAFNKFSPKLFITSDIQNHIGRIFAFTARERGVKLYTFNHGCSLQTPWLNAVERLGDKVLISGQRVAQNIQRAGVSQDRIIIVGEKEIKEAEKEKQYLSNSYQKEGKKTVAIITPMKLGNWTEPRNLQLFFKNIEKLTKGFLEAGFEVIIKSHKIEDYFAFYDDLSYRYKVKHIRERWTLDKFSSCNAVVFVGGISTTILNCQAIGVPVVYIDILSKIEKEIIRYDIVDCGVMVKNAEEAVSAVKRLFIDKNYLEEVIDKGRQFYEDNVNIERNFDQELINLIENYE